MIGRINRLYLNRDLLTRREFFKKATKGTLPFIAAITVPSFLSSCGGGNNDPIETGCSWCSSNCEGSCEDSCDNSCVKNNANSSCSDCSSTCKDGCKDECSETCKNTAKSEDNNTNEKYEAVDLGLSVLWATHNMGATKSTEYSPHYYWGRKEGESYADWKSWLNEGKYNISATDRDIVRTTWGGDWRLPTDSEIRELAELCTYSYQTINGVNGLNVTGSNGKSIFLPASEKSMNKELGAFMTDKRLTTESIQILFFDKNSFKRNATGIDTSLNIRPVMDGGSGCKECSNGCSTGCENGCENGCLKKCGGDCTGNCVTVCSATCGGNCNDSCKDDCYVTCNKSCGNGCYEGCYNGCYGNCYNTCGVSCVVVAGNG